MVTKTIDLQQTPTSLEELLELLQTDTEIVLTRGEEPVARLSPIQRKQRIPGLHRGTTWVSDDFDDPLPDSFWLGEE